jgi:hypothetical protein
LLVWLFLGATQVLTLVAAPARISRLERALQKMPDEPAFTEVREGFEQSQREDRFRLACAAVLAPLFLGAALWRWSRGRSGPARMAQPAAAAGTSKAEAVGDPR